MDFPPIFETKNVCRIIEVVVQRFRCVLLLKWYLIDFHSMILRYLRQDWLFSWQDIYMLFISVKCHFFKVLLALYLGLMYVPCNNRTETSGDINLIQKLKHPFACNCKSVSASFKHAVWFQSFTKYQHIHVNYPYTSIHRVFLPLPLHI